MTTVALSGVGWGEISRPAGRIEGDLALDACAAALEDAGLSPDDVDGVATYPGTKGSVSPWHVTTGLGLRRLRWFGDVGGGPAAASALFAAVGAVAAGWAEVVVAFRAVCRPTGRGAGGVAPDDTSLSDDYAFKVPYGAFTASQWIAFWAQAHMAEYGTTAEHLGAVAMAHRAHAAANPRAVAREPFDLDTYLASPMVSDPFRLLDCDMPVDGSAAVVVTTVERARDLAPPPVVVEALSCAPGPVPDWDQWEDFRVMAAHYAAADMWAQCPGIGPADVDVAELYDGFSFLTISWLEAFGFCGPGEGGPFVADGRTGPGGALPVNTHGGNLSEGRLHGMSHIAEAAHQLQGRAGERQVPGAEVAVVSAGGGPLAGAMVLTVDR